MSPVSRGLLRWLPVVASVGLVALHVELWLARVGYAYDLEWMEGGVLAHAWRLQRGLPLFVDPSPDFVPFIYPPGYPALLAALGSVFGLGPALGRTVSLVGFAAAAAGAAFLVARTTSRDGHGPSPRAAGFAAAALVGTYQGVGAYYDLVRADSVFLALLLWSVALALEPGRWTAVSAGLLLAASFTMKHNAAAWGLPLALVVWWRHGWRRALGFGLAAAVPAGLLAARWEWASDGRFTRYLLEVPAGHPMLPDRVWPDLPRQAGDTLPVLLALVAAWCWRGAAGGRAGAAGLVVPPTLGVIAGWATGWAVEAGWRGTWEGAPSGVLPTRVLASTAVGGFALSAGPVALAAWLAAGAGRRALVTPTVLVGATAVFATAMWAHNGGFLNVLAPLYAAVVVAAAVLLVRLERAGFPAVAAALMVAHLAWAGWRLERHRLRPTAEDVEAGDHVVAVLRTVEGPVLSPYAAWVPTYAGHAPSVHMMAVRDLLYVGGPFEAEVRGLEDAVAARRWAAVLSHHAPPELGVGVAYPEAETLIPVGSPALAPKTGHLLGRPARLLRPPP
jgi:hypothetical protein